MHACPELIRLVEMSARIGAEPHLIQGPGGNTSLKEGDCLWVKASGFWLANAARENVFVTLSLPAVRAQLAEGHADDFLPCLIGSSALKPSIETAFHAMLPHAVIIHAHAHNCMAISSLVDGEARFLQAMTATASDPGLRGAWVPYRRPGGPLAGEIAAILSRSPVDVLLLQNHGVIVGGDTTASAERLLREVEQRLTLQERERPAVDAAKAAAHATADYPADADISDVVLNPRLVHIAGHLPLIPDQVVFLGGAVCVADPVSGIDAAAAAVKASTGIQPALVLLPDIGAYRWSGRTSGADSVIDGLVAILRRLPDDVEIHTLTLAETADLLGWDAEHYRQRLDKKHA